MMIVGGAGLLGNTIAVIVLLRSVGFLIFATEVQTLFTKNVALISLPV